MLDCFAAPLPAEEGTVSVFIRDNAEDARARAHSDALGFRDVTRPPSHAEGMTHAVSAFAGTDTTESPALGSFSTPQSGSLDLKAVVHKYHNMIVDMRSRESQRDLQGQEDKENIRQLENTIKLMEVNHRRQLDRAQQDNRQLIQRLLDADR